MYTPPLCQESNVHHQYNKPGEYILTNAGKGLASDGRGTPWKLTRMHGVREVPAKHEAGKRIVIAADRKRVVILIKDEVAACRVRRSRHGTAKGKEHVC